MMHRRPISWRSVLVASAPVAAIAFGAPTTQAEPPDAAPPVAAVDASDDMKDEPRGGASGTAGDCPKGALCEEVAVPSGTPDDDEATASDGDDRSGQDLEQQAADQEEDDAPPLRSERIGWQPEGDVPEGKGHSQVGEGMIEAGIVIFLIGYLPASFVGALALAIEDEDHDDTSDAEPLIPLLLPVAGPPITGALLKAEPGTWIALGGSAGLQVVGLTLLAIGIALEGDSDSSASVHPVVVGDGRTSVGAGLVGAF